MTASDKCLDIIKEFEGLKLTAYQDSVGIWTIGYGHTRGVHEGDTVTQAQANYNLAVDVEGAEQAVNRMVPESCTQNQFDALVSWTFNLGAGSLKTMLAHGWDNVPTEMVRWDKAGGKVLPGLTRRREAERDLFLSGGSAPAS